MEDTLDPKEAKILADILALTLDEQSGQAEAALRKLQQRARDDGITGGALKNMFARLAGERGRAPTPGSAGNWFTQAEQRAITAEQAATISLLEQRLAMLQARLNQSEMRRQDEIAALGWQARRARVQAIVTGLALGGAGVGLVIFLLQRPASVPWAGNGAFPRPVATHQDARAVAVTPPPDPKLIPAMRDPDDTAPAPEYPPEALRRGAEGVVQLMVYVAADGQVVAVAVTHSTGSSDLDVAAEAAVRQWRFRPATRDGVPVANAVPLTFRFMLHH